MKTIVLKFTLGGLLTLISLSDVCMAAPVHEAAERGDLAAIKEFIGNSISSINEEDDHGWTPLHYAATRGDFETVKYLLARGADVNVKENMGYTPLINAAALGQYEVVKYLVEHGADLNVKVCVAETVKSRLREDHSLETVVLSEDYATALDFASNTIFRKDDMMADYLKSKGARSAKNDNNVYKTKRLGGSMAVIKIIIFVILTGVIIGISPLVIRAVRMAVLKYRLRRSSKTVVLITSPDKDGTKVNIAYPKGMSAEDRKTVKEIIETSSKS